MTRARALPALLLTIAVACDAEPDRAPVDGGPSGAASRFVAGPPEPGSTPTAFPRDLEREGWAAELPGLYGLAPGAADRAASEDGLSKLGYAGGSEAPRGARSGVVVLDEQRSAPGYNLVLSGHEPAATLIDARGDPVHRWRFDYADVPNAPEVEDPQLAAVWRTARLLPGGDLLAIFEGHALVRLTRDSELVWAFGARPHHALGVTADGELLVLTRRVDTVPWVNADEPVYVDAITRLDPATGRELGRLDVFDAFERSAFRDLVESAPARVGDVLHTNALRVLDGTGADRLAALRSGNVLLSMRHTHALAIVDLEAGRVVWAKTGVWRLQHDPTVLDDGSILLFDNAGFGLSSQVIELDPRTGGVEWAWRGDPPDAFFTLFCGGAQRLSGGTTLITESCRGRAFEVTRDGEVVWEYVNPHRAGEDGEWIASLLEVRRVPTSDVDAWLER